MATYEITTELVVTCTVKVLVEADDKDSAIEAATELLPFHDDQRGMKATVAIKAPKGVDLKVVKAFHIAQASGSEKARRIP